MARTQLPHRKAPVAEHSFMCLWFSGDSGCSRGCFHCCKVFVSGPFHGRRSFSPLNESDFGFQTVSVVWLGWGRQGEMLTIINNGVSPWTDHSATTNSPKTSKPSRTLQNPAYFQDINAYIVHDKTQYIIVKNFPLLYT